jgi:hypothetical protein
MGAAQSLKAHGVAHCGGACMSPGGGAWSRLLCLSLSGLLSFTDAWPLASRAGSRKGRLPGTSTLKFKFGYWMSEPLGCAG